MTSYSYISPARKAVKKLNDLYNRAESLNNVESTLFYIEFLQKLISQAETTTPPAIKDLIQKIHSEIAQIFPIIESPDPEIPPNDISTALESHFRLKKNKKPQLTYLQDLHEKIDLSPTSSYNFTLTLLQEIQETYTDLDTPEIIRNFISTILEEITSEQFNKKSYLLIPKDLPFQVAINLKHINDLYRYQTEPIPRTILKSSLEATTKFIKSPQEYMGISSAFEDFTDLHLSETPQSKHEKTTQEGPQVLKGFQDNQVTPTHTEPPPEFHKFIKDEPTRVSNILELIKQTPLPKHNSEDLIPETNGFTTVKHLKNPEE